MAVQDAITRTGDAVSFNIFQKQSEFLGSDCDDVLFGGAAGGGKSFAILLFCAQRRLAYPGSVGIAFRRTFPELEKSLILESQKMYRLLGAKWNQSEKKWSFPNGSVQYFGYCFDDQTDVLTRSGWKRFADLAEGDEVASVDPEGHLVFAAPSRRIAYAHKGDMVALSQRNGANFCVTPEHRFLVQKKNGRIWTPPRIERAAEIRGTSRIRRSFILNSSMSDDAVIHFGRVKGGHGKQIQAPVVPFAKFLGWFLSEGCLTKKPKYETIIFQKNYLDAVRTDVAACGLTSYVVVPKRKENVPRVTIPGKELHAWLSARTGGLAKDKRIPRECFAWPRLARENLLRGLLMGDGHYDPRRRHEFRSNFRTTSPGLADDIQELCAGLELCATISPVPAGQRMLRGILRSCRAQYNVSIAPRVFSEFRFKQLERRTYDGMVYCVSVDPYQTLVVRRNGRICLSMNCEKDGDVYNHQSAQYHDMCFDEATHFTHFQFSYLLSRCRSTLVIAGEKVRPLVRLASNPGGVGHQWVFDRYIKPSQTNRKWFDAKTEKWLTFIPARISDNPVLCEVDPAYYNRLKDLPEKKFLALAEGRWDVFEGIYFTEWGPRCVLPHRRQPDSHTIKFLSLDWGFADPACVLWWEVTPLGRVFVYRELYTSRRSPKELGQDILALSPESERYAYMAASPEIWGKKVETENGGQPIQELLQEGLGDRITMRKANNARVPGWLKIREYLAEAPDGYPWMQVSPGCGNLLRTIPGLVHDERTPEDIDPACEDHAAEALRYGIMSLDFVPRRVMTPHRSNYEKIFGSPDEGARRPGDIPMAGRGGYGFIWLFGFFLTGVINAIRYL